MSTAGDGGKRDPPRWDPRRRLPTSSEPPPPQEEEDQGSDDEQPFRKRSTSFHGKAPSKDLRCLMRARRSAEEAARKAGKTPPKQTPPNPRKRATPKKRSPRDETVALAALGIGGKKEYRLEEARRKRAQEGAEGEDEGAGPSKRLWLQSRESKDNQSTDSNDSSDPSSGKPGTSSDEDMKLQSAPSFTQFTNYNAVEEGGGREGERREEEYEGLVRGRYGRVEETIEEEEEEGIAEEGEKVK